MPCISRRLSSKEKAFGKTGVLMERIDPCKARARIRTRALGLHINFLDNTENKFPYQYSYYKPKKEKLDVVLQAFLYAQ